MGRLCPFKVNQVVYHISIKKIRTIRHYEDYDYFGFYDGTHSFSWSIGMSLFDNKEEAEEALKKMREE